MALVPFDTQLIVTRLSTNIGDGDTQWRAADFAADNAAAIADRAMPMPSVYVMEPSFTADQSGQGASGTLVNVPHEYEVGVLTIVQNYSGDAGKQQSITARNLRAQLWQLMLGWSPENSGFVFYLGRGQLLEFDDTCFFYVDIFNLNRIVRNN